MKISTGLITALGAILLLLAGCRDIETFDNDPYGNFDCLATLVDEHYCFFDEKGIDWQTTTKKYRERIIPDINNYELFALMAEMLDELEDGHVNLSSSFDVSYYRKWWTDYPQDFDLRTIQQYYLNFDWRTTSGLIYKILPDNVGYLYYPSFANEVGPGNLDYVLNHLAVCDAIIIDIRDNGGGDLTNIETFVSRFIHDKGTYGYIRHKTGPAHDALSDPYPIEYTPAGDSRINWDKPIFVLINRSCFSAANDFACVMKQLPNVKLVGARTGGGGGMPFTYPLPNGWNLRLSASPVLDAQGHSIENGIDPSEGCEVHCSPLELAAGKDAILDFALQLAKQ